MEHLTADYWFTSEDGEDFFVEAYSLKQAKEVAEEYFGEGCKSHGKVSYEFAESMGWDTY